MPDRHSLPDRHTVRPERSSGAASALPTIADVLRLDAVTAAAPEVLTASDHLDATVRWVHVTETESVVGFVSGGELLLTTGVGWLGRTDDLEGYVAELADAGVAGLVLELGRQIADAPDALVAACAARAIPLIVLHRPARFIAITEAVHSRIIADQMNALRARDEIHALFTELSLRGSPADFIVAQLGRTLGSPVVLEDLAHNVIAAETLDEPGDVLDEWEQRSRAAHRSVGTVNGAGTGPTGDDDWLIVPVEARGSRWGHLIALPGDTHPAGRSNVLEQGAVALALNRLADRDADEWVRQSQQNLVATLLGGRYRSEEGLRAQLEAAGLPVGQRRLFGIALSGRGTPTVLAAVRAAARDAGVDAVAGIRQETLGTSAPMVVVAVSIAAAGTAVDSLIDAFARALADSTDARDLVVAVGSEATDLQGLLSSIDEAGELLNRGGPRGRGLTVHRAQSRPLLRLITSFGGDPRLQAHSEQMLRPLIEHDLATGGDLLDVLEAYAAHPGNRTRAAASSHLSRSVFYQRIALIEELLGVDLDDGETVSALHAALLARRRPAR